MAAATRVLILPGWQNSGAAHWQSRWQALHGFEDSGLSGWPEGLDGLRRLRQGVR